MDHKKILKGVVFLATGFCTSSVYAVTAGFYMGLMAGPATNDGGQQNVQVLPLPTQATPIANKSPANPKSTQFGSRVFLGYKFNAMAGFEFGFTYFSGIGYILTDSTKTSAAGTTFRVRALDLVGKLDYSFVGIGVLGKAGVAAMYTTTPGGLNITNWHTVTTLDRARNTTSTRVVNVGTNTYSTKLAPTFSIGASYDLTQSWVADFSLTTYMVGSTIGNVSLFALGLSYHFVDRYCGQFLCDD